MRKRDIQGFTLKLSDLKEYEIVREERAAARQMEKPESSTGQVLAPPIIKQGPKSKQEVRERIGAPHD